MGAVKHEEVKDVMIQGEIYLHPSLTEAFGTVIVEAASCGLFVVTTKVGGIPEVLPNHMTNFANPEEDSLVDATLKAIDLIQSGKIDTSKFHGQVAKMYSWENIAKRTENVYNSLDLKKLNQPLLTRLRKYYCCGFIAAEHIDLATKWPKKNKLKKLNGLDDLDIDID
ncbi:hypothetical protein QCA50_015935 [Cerrena zonata]|uniref:Glycosyl transferase family 1 domain-containing protein n=1 Tax=Cerrena zonata TaxID=2478898 RepID=A0AAW0FLQ6_9APHY